MCAAYCYSGISRQASADTKGSRCALNSTRGVRKCTVLLSDLFDKSFCDIYAVLRQLSTPDFSLQAVKSENEGVSCLKSHKSTLKPVWRPKSQREFQDIKSMTVTDNGTQQFSRIVTWAEQRPLSKFPSTNIQSKCSQVSMIFRFVGYRTQEGWTSQDLTSHINACHVTSSKTTSIKLKWILIQRKYTYYRR